MYFGEVEGVCVGMWDDDGRLRQKKARLAWDVVLIESHHSAGRACAVEVEVCDDRNWLMPTQKLPASVRQVTVNSPQRPTITRSKILNERRISKTQRGSCQGELYGRNARAGLCGAESPTFRVRV